MGFFSSSETAPLTEKNLPDQSGKVFIVTGSTGGVGKELAQILFSHNAKVYVAARSADKAKETIKGIQQANPKSSGELVFLRLDLNDLTTIKAAADEFLSKEKKLDVLWNNAGVMIPPQGSVTAQNYELQLGTNNVAPFLFTKLLTPLLLETAKTVPAGSVRVVWVASSAAAKFSPNRGVEMDNLTYKIERSAWTKYGTSKAGNILHATEYALRYGSSGILSLSLDPGNLKTDLWKTLPSWQKPLLSLALHDPVWGAYTELFAGLSDTLTAEDNGVFIKPWGMVGPARKDIEASMKRKADGGTGVGEQFWDWTEAQVAPYV